MIGIEIHDRIKDTTHHWYIINFADVFDNEALATMALPIVVSDSLKKLKPLYDQFGDSLFEDTYLKPRRIGVYLVSIVRIS